MSLDSIFNRKHLPLSHLPSTYHQTLLPFYHPLSLISNYFQAKNNAPQVIFK